jgi:hypothetical protein
MGRISWEKLLTGPEKGSSLTRIRNSFITKQHKRIPTQPFDFAMFSPDFVGLDWDGLVSL